MINYFLIIYSPPEEFESQIKFLTNNPDKNYSNELLEKFLKYKDYDPTEVYKTD